LPEADFAAYGSADSGRAASGGARRPAEPPCRAVRALPCACLCALPCGVRGASPVRREKLNRKPPHYGQVTDAPRTMHGQITNKRSRGDRPTTDNQPVKPRNPYPPSTAIQHRKRTLNKPTVISITYFAAQFLPFVPPHLYKCGGSQITTPAPTAFQRTELGPRTDSTPGGKRTDTDMRRTTTPHTYKDIPAQSPVPHSHTPYFHPYQHRTSSSRFE